jgi:hypothetical protein
LPAAVADYIKENNLYRTGVHDKSN